MPTWINFKELRHKLRFEDILRHYTIEVKRRGGRVTAFCPLPGHPPRTDGSPRTASLSINLAKNIFQCFGCKASGNALEFACRMEGFDPSNPEEFPIAARRIAEVFGIEAGRRETTAASSKSDCRVDPKPVQSTSPQKSELPVVINAPLNFELKDLDGDHPYLPGRRYTPETIAHFGLGFCNRGLMKGRIVIPLHNPKGELVGYAGRITKDEMISDECPKYRFPGSRVREGVRNEFRKSHLLYNAHRIIAPVDQLFVVEGFTGTWSLWQAKYRNTVALMGSSCSDEQAALIVSLVKPDGKVWLMPDGNNAGIECAKSLLYRISPYRFVRWVCVRPEMQPTDFDGHELAAMFNPSIANQ